MTAKRALWFGTASMLLFIGADAATAFQQPATRPVVTSDTPATASSASPARRAKMILGSKMHIQGNVSIGTVDDIVFNDDGYVEFLVVLNEGKLVAVPWQAAKFDFEKRTAIVNIEQARWREVPTFTVQSYPNFYEPTYRTKIYGYYGITPAAERRIERREDRRDHNKN